MDRDAIIAKLKAQTAAFRALGIDALYLFGSAVRGGRRVDFLTRKGNVGGASFLMRLDLYLPPEGEGGSARSAMTDGGC